MKQITVWPDGDAWIVSEDEVEEIGAGSEDSNTIAVLDTEAVAEKRARGEGRKRNLPVVKQDYQGIPTVIS